MAWRLAASLSTAALAAEFEVTVPDLGLLKGTDVVPGDSRALYEGVAQFYGIPYSKPPVGSLRFQPPQAHGPWESPRDATAFGKACMAKPGADVKPKTMGFSEDCLFLNVAAPQSALGTTTKLPVMLWIHGGSYQTGAASDYPIEALVAHSNHSVVVAAMNYRLNTFGFLGGSEIQARTVDGSSGNFGIQDQRQAMAWVREHIAAFGGNGEDITIFGESAGGNSVMNHISQPASFPFYRKAIVESGTYTRGAADMTSAESSYKSVLKGTGCEDLDCLLALDAETLSSKGGGGGPGPVIDGVSLTAAPWDLVDQGKHNTNATIIVGSNRDETAMVTAELPKKLPEVVFDTVATALGGLGGAKKLKQLYDPANYPYPSDLGGYNHWWWATTRATTDMIPSLGHCAGRAYARALRAGGSPKVYIYLFAKPSDTAPIDPSTYIVSHAAEIGFVYGATYNLTTPEEKELATAMSAYWSSFAINGDPNHVGLPQWPEYEADSDTNMRFEDAPSLGGIYTQQGLRKDACDYWDTKAGLDSAQGGDFIESLTDLIEAALASNGAEIV